MWKKLPQNFILHIYGTGTYKEYVEGEAKKNSNIEFYGFKPQEIIFQDILKSVAVVITSECYETFGMGIPESFSLATPVVCTNLGNSKLMIERSKGGVVYRMNDFDSFYSSLDKVLENNFIYSKNAFSCFKKELNDKVNYERLSDIYDKAKII